MDSYLAHHGIKGQKWGIRRYQNEDGSLTSAGQKRYNPESRRTKKLKKSINAVNKDISSYDPIRGKDLTYKNGKVYATKDDVERWRQGSVDKKTALENRLSESQQRDKVAGDFYKRKDELRANRTTGQKCANFLLNGPIGAGLYTNLRTAGYGVVGAEGGVFLSTLLGGPFGQTAAYLVTRSGIPK